MLCVEEKPVGCRSAGLYVAREIAAYSRPGSQVAEVRCRQADWRVAASTGARIVTASDDKTARIWDTRVETMPAKGHMAEACALGRGDETVTRRNAARRPARQQRTLPPDAPPSVRVRIAAVGAVIGIAVAAPVIVGAVIPVSYTHLTLPTIYSV